MSSVKLSASLRSSLERAVHRYEQNVDRAAEYLVGRGLDAEVAATYRLGYVTEPEPGHDQYTGRLSIPYLSPAGVVGLRFRALDDSEPKYLGLPGAQTGIYNADALHNPSNIIGITEGEFDSVVLTSKCGIPAVGIPGAQSWKPHYARCLQDYERVLVFCDGDKPGRELGKTVAREIPGAVVIHLPDGEDVNSVYLKEGPQWLRKRAGL